MAVRLRRAAPYFVVGWLWFLGTLVPVIGLVQVGSQAYADRYTYLPHIGLFVAVVWGIADLAVRLRMPAAVPAGLAVVAAVGCLAVTWHQIRFWADTLTLWDRALAVTPTNPTAHYNLGTELMHAGRWAEAADHLAIAAQFQPKKFDVRSNRAVALYELGRVAEAEPEAVAALAVAPDKPAVVAALLFIAAEASAGRGNGSEAAARYAASLRVEDAPLTRRGFGRLLLRAGRPADAVVHLRAARALDPDNPEVAAELAAAERAAR